MDLCAMGGLLPAGNRWKGGKGNGTTGILSSLQIPTEHVWLLMSCSPHTSTPQSSSTGLLPAHQSPGLLVPSPLLAQWSSLDNLLEEGTKVLTRALLRAQQSSGMGKAEGFPCTAA